MGTSLEVAPIVLVLKNRQTQKMRADVAYLQFQIQIYFCLASA